MSNLTENLNFSLTDDNMRSIQIDPTRGVNFYDTLCLYCANNDVNLSSVINSDFDSAVIAMESYGAANPLPYFFWIEE